MERKVYKNFTYGELEAAFDVLKVPNDWKAEISMVAPKDMSRELITAAIEFYTATSPDFYNYDGDVWIYAEGYRMGPAGP